MKRVLHWLLAGVCLWATFAVLAQGLQPVPALSVRVVDPTGTLDAAQRQAIEAPLAALEQRKGAQVLFLIVASSAPEDIASYANRVGNAWKIGRQGVGDGVLLIVAKDDRKVRIEVAKTLEGALPDLAARQIIDEAITPAFRRGDYAGGLQAAAERIAARIDPEALPAPATASGNAARRGGLGGFDWFDLAVFMFFAVPVGGAVLRRTFGRKLGSLITGGGVGALAMLLTSSLVIAGVAAVLALLFSVLGGAGLGRRGGFSGGPFIGGGGFGGGGGSSWGGGGGGFSSGGGGGGDFGGGGASGDW